MNFLQRLVLPIVKNLLRANVDKLDILEGRFVDLLSKELPADQSAQLAHALLEATKAELLKYIEKI
jgi:hypothetical protein